MAGLRLLLIAVLLLASPGAWAKGTDGESHFAGLDGFLVHYKTWGNKSGTPVILVHGFALDHTFWRHQIPVLAKTHQVIALDLPGHGGSGRPRDVEYTQTLYARAVEAVAHEVGISHAALVGHSMGLPIIHTVLRRGVLKVDKVAYVDGAIADKVPPAERDRLVTALESPNTQLVLEQFATPLMQKAPPALQQEIAARMRSVEQYVAVSTFRHISDEDVWAPLRSSVPALAVYSTMSSRGVREWMDAHYSKSRTIIWSDVDHFPQLEQPTRLNALLVDFLR